MKSLILCNIISLPLSPNNTRRRIIRQSAHRSIKKRVHRNILQIQNRYKKRFH